MDSMIAAAESASVSMSDLDIQLRGFESFDRGMDAGRWVVRNKPSYVYADVESRLSERLALRLAADGHLSAAAYHYGTMIALTEEE